MPSESSSAKKGPRPDSGQPCGYASKTKAIDLGRCGPNSSPTRLAAQTRHLGPPLAYLYAESGDVNTIVHQWAYEDAADRMRRRANMWADPEWLAYIKRLNESGYLVEQRTSLMIPTKFCPIKR